VACGSVLSLLFEMGEKCVRSELRSLLFVGMVVWLFPLPVTRQLSKPNSFFAHKAIFLYRYSAVSAKAVNMTTFLLFGLSGFFIFCVMFSLRDWSFLSLEASTCSELPKSSSSFCKSFCKSCFHLILSTS